MQDNPYKTAEQMLDEAMKFVGAPPQREYEEITIKVAKYLDADGNLIPRSEPVAS